MSSSYSDDSTSAKYVDRRLIADGTDALEDSSGSDSDAQSHDEDSAVASSWSSSGTTVDASTSRPRSRHHGDGECRSRREIANSNERRRMQSINAGFQSLRNLVRPRCGEKLSKAAILQRAVDYILDLNRQKAQLVAKNTRLVQMLGTGNIGPDSMTSHSPAAKRRRLESMSSCSLSSDDGLVDAPPGGNKRRKLSNVEMRLIVDDLPVSVKPGHVDVVDDQNVTFQLASILSLPASMSSPSLQHCSTSSCDENLRNLLTCVIPSASPLSVWNSSTATTTTSTVVASSAPTWPSTSRRNLDTIIEAIRLLEGDHQGRGLDGDSKMHGRREDVACSVLDNAFSGVQLTSPNTCVAVRSS